MASRSGRVVAVGALAVAAVAFLLALALSSGGYRVTAVVNQAHGLVAGGEVQAAGFKVGEIKAIELGDDGLPRVRMEIEDGYRLRQGASADVRLFSASGEVNRYVALERGSGEELPDGAVLPPAATDEPEEIDQILETLDARTRAQVRGLFEALDASTAGRGGDIERTLAHSADALHETAAVIDQVNADSKALRTFVEKGRRVVSALAAEPAALGGTVDELAALLDTTARRQAELAEGIRFLPQGLGEPRLALERTRAAIPNLRTLVRIGRPAIRELVPFARELRPALADARPTLDEAERLIRTGPADLRRLEPLLRDLRPLLPRLSNALEGTGPVTDDLRARLPDVFGFFANWADFTAAYDANGNGGRVAIIPAAPAPVYGGPGDAPYRNLIAPGSCEPDGTTAPGLLPAPFDRTPGVLGCDAWLDYEDSFIAGDAP